VRGTIGRVTVILPERAARIAMIARWKPVHLGHAAVLHALLDRADAVVVGVGSANRYDLDNPFTATETARMIDAALDGRAGYTIVRFDDLGDGPRWADRVVGALGPLDYYVTANGYVRSLLMHRYTVVHPVALLDPARRVRVDGTMVRRALAAEGDGWRALVPPAVAALIDREGWAARFRREFGAATRAAELAEGAEAAMRRGDGLD
jgi:nicotinamide-nucleotide adenylyltransferase